MPLTAMDLQSNTNRDDLYHFRKQFGITFPDVSAELICDGDRTALLRCLDVIDFLKAKAQESASAQGTPHWISFICIVCHVLITYFFHDSCRVEDAIRSSPSSSACREQHMTPEPQSPNQDDSATAFKSTDGEINSRQYELAAFLLLFCTVISKQC